MTTKTVSQLDAAGYFVGATVAPANPLQPGAFLIPGGAIDRTPPTVPEGQRAKWTGSAWAMEAIPEPPAPPAPPPPPTAQQIRRSEITARLLAIDTESVRPLRAALIEQAAGKPAPAFERGKLAALETEAAALRAELQAIQ
jgi:hypothetical protein